MKVIKNDRPKLKMPKFRVDIPLSKHLDDDPLLSNMNRTFCCIMVGKPASGKSSLMTSFLRTKKKYYQVFDKIYLFMPESSRNSMSDDPFKTIPEERKFEGVSLQNLSEVYDQMLETSENDEFSCLVFDDVQSYLKNKDVIKSLTHIIQNRRHLRCCIFILVQNYKKIPLDIRSSCSDAFLFNISKEEYKFVFDEIVNASKKEFGEILKHYRDAKTQQKNSFIYIHDFDTFFINWDKIVLDDDLEL
jgi:GTPase SAR1 family protein